MCFKKKSEQKVMQVDAFFFSPQVIMTMANDVNSILVFDHSTNHLACFEQKLD